MKMDRNRFLALLFVVGTASCLVTGCDSGETLGPVSGTVTFQGQPVTNGRVLFQNAKEGIYMTANLDEKGHYEVRRPEGTGLPLGEYNVSVNPPVIDAPMAGSGKPVNIPTFPNIPAKYRTASTSGLKVTVTEEGTTLDIDMKP